MLNKKVKIDVYLSREHKKEIQKRAAKLDLSVSDYMKLKALDMLVNPCDCRHDQSRLSVIDKIKNEK